MRKVLAVSLFAFTLLAGCRAKEAFDKAAISHDLAHHGTSDLMKQVADDHYAPPKDGRLTDGQVQMYLKVRNHEGDIAQVARKEAQAHADAAKAAGEKSLTGLMEGFKTMGSVADMATADIRAAKDLHYNTQEYLWVKGQILAASTSAMAAKTSQAMSAGMDQSYQQMKKAYDEAKDDATKKVYADAMASYDKQRQEMSSTQPKEDDTVTYNRQLLSKYEDAMNALANEMDKWSDKQGEAQKSVQQWNKDLDKTIQQAKEQPKQP